MKLSLVSWGIFLSFFFNSQSFTYGFDQKLDVDLIKTHTVKSEFCDIYDGQADRISLNGVWKFRPVVNFLEKANGRIVCNVKKTENPQTDEGLEKQFYKTEFDDSSWSEMMVPWVWNLSLPYKTNKKEPFAGVGYYRKKFSIPQRHEGKRVFITFDAVQSECKVWVNGKLVGEHKNERASTGSWHNYDEYVFLDHFTLDITDAIKSGTENVITVRVFDDGLPIASGVWPDDGGIASPVTIEIKPQVYCENILLASDTDTCKIKLNFELKNKLKADWNSDLFAEISTYNSKYYQAAVQQKAQTHKLGKLTIPGLSERALDFSFKMKEPVFWSPETPQLYMLKLKDSKGNVIGYSRFGFRTFTTRNGDFYLNGKPIYLFGCNPDAGPWNKTFRILAYNHSNYLRYVLKLFKDLNINYVRAHRGPASKQFHNLCDEIGLLVSVDFSPDGKLLDFKKVERLEQMEDVFISQYLTKNGELTDSFKKILRTFVRFVHNNPSVFSFNAGNELGKKNQVSDGVAQYFDKFYDFIKSEDLQKRPLTPSTGLVVWQWKKKIKADYYDYHDYPVSRHGWADIIPENFACYRFVEKIFGKDQMNKPMINGETLFLTRDVKALKSYQKIFPDGKLDVSKYVQWIKDNKRTKYTKNYLDFVWQYWYVRNKGIRSMSSKAARRQAAAEILEDVIRIYRRDMDFLDGVVPHAITPGRYGWFEKNSGVTVEQVKQGYLKAKKHPEFMPLRRSFSRLYAAVDMFDRNLFAGQPLKTKLFVINNTFGKRLNNISAQISLESSKGIISEQNFKISKIGENQKIVRRVGLSIPKNTATGQYNVKIVLTGNEGKLFESSTGLFVLNRNTFEPIKSSKPINLYDPSGNVENILKKFRIRYHLIKDFNHLEKYKVLLLGPSSFDHELISKGEKINKWIRQGGTVVCFSQVRNGSIPFYKPLKIESAGAVLTTDMIKPESPILSGMQPTNWDLWNGPREVVKNSLAAGNKKIFTHYITPVTKDVLVSGAKRGGQWYTNIPIGMVVADVKLEKGRIILSQALACERFNKDSSATLYLYNILKSAINYEYKENACLQKLAKIKKVLIVGNSLTKHGPSTEKLGWPYSFGMAATSRENDYAHQLYTRICGAQLPKGRKPEFKIRTMLAYKISVSEELIDYQADFIVLQMGDNLRDPLITQKDFVMPYINLVKALKQANKDATIVLTSLWSPEPKRNAMVQQVAKETGSIFVDLRPLSADPRNSAKAEGNFKHAGVNWHPGNRGMNKIAEAIWNIVNNQ